MQFPSHRPDFPGLSGALANDQNWPVTIRALAGGYQQEGTQKRLLNALLKCPFQKKYKREPHRENKFHPPPWQISTRSRVPIAVSLGITDPLQGAGERQEGSHWQILLQKSPQPHNSVSSLSDTGMSNCRVIHYSTSKARKEKMVQLLEDCTAPHCDREN